MKDDTIYRQAAIDAAERESQVDGSYGYMDTKSIVDMLNDLPSAQPERKKGKWINANDGKWNTVEVLKCSVCGEMDNRMYRTDNFCPNCGADMRGADGDG